MKHVLGSLDDEFAEYAVQYIVSDGNIYRRYVTPLIANYAKKVVNGTYDSEKAVTGFIGIIDAVLPEVKRAYNEYREYTCVDRVSYETKRTIAVEMNSEYAELLRDMVTDLRAKRQHNTAKPDDYIRREVKMRSQSEKPAYQRKAEFYDVTQVTKDGKQAFVAKVKTLDNARMIASQTADKPDVKEARIIKWYQLKDGTNSRKVKETYSKHRKEVKERKVF